MIHAVCDFCGKDADRSAMLVTITPFQNFARYHDDSKPFGYTGKPASFVCCSSCLEKHQLPNPYHDYRSIDRQKLSYNKCLDNYTDEDRKADVHAAAQANPIRPKTPVAPSDVDEFIGQLIDQVEDAVSDETGETDTVHVNPGRYEALKTRFTALLQNWGVIAKQNDPPGGGE